MFHILLFVPFFLFVLTNVLSVLLQFTASDYSFDIFKFFLKQNISNINHSTFCICSSGSVNKQIHYENYTENISNAVAIQHVIFLSLLQSICSYQSTLNDFLVDFLIMTENVFHVLIITYSSECNQ